jgi:polyvinyl alcohol dehydrogenase (cytochrome)
MLPMRTHVFVGTMALMFAAGVANAQGTDGAAVFARACASCHDAAAGSRAPSLDSLRGRSAQAVMDALLTGAMRMQGARITGAERRAVAEYVTGKTLGAPTSNPEVGRCAASPPFTVSPSGPMWSGWGAVITNTHAQPAVQAGLNAADVPRLKLKWSFGFPDSSQAYSQPSVAGGRVFVGSHSGAVYSLDARSGCMYWAYQAKSAVRSAISIGPRTGGSGVAIYFGDLSGNVYALDAGSGDVIWLRALEKHPYGRITGSPTLYRDRLYVPVASLEESMAANPEYGCCTFRGSLAALDTATGTTVWQASTITEPLAPRGKNSLGHTLYGPSGAPIWSAPTIDVKRGAIYASTGNMYSGPQQPTSDAVIAFDLATGAIRWSHQMTPKDIFPCRKGNSNCLEDESGDDYDFGNSPVLTTLPGGKDLIVIGQKSGVGWAIDPDRRGEVVWQYRAGEGGTLGGIEWGTAVDAEHAYFPVSDIQRDHPGGLHAVTLTTGERAWYAAPQPPLCGAGPNCNAAQSAAITVIPGVVFSGSNDGGLRAYSAKDGSILWSYDTNRSFDTVNGVAARGASLIGPGPTVVGGMVFVNSGYGAYGGRPGNVLLAFGLEP